MAISGKRLVGIVITVFMSAGSLVFIYEQYQKGKKHQQVKKFTQEERRAYLYATYKKAFRSRVSDSAILDRCCACLADTIVKRFSDEELLAIERMPEREQQQRMGDINDYCRIKSGLDSLLNSR